MRHAPCKRCFFICQLYEAAGDVKIGAGQREGVDVGCVKDRECERQVWKFRDDGEGLANAANIGLERVGGVSSAPLILDLWVLLFPGLTLLVRRY